MAWETRRGKGRYYTRSRRVGKRVIREYVPKALAELVAEVDRLDRLARDAECAKRREERARLATIDEELDELDQVCVSLARVALLSSGYHQHNGEWRRRRVGS